MKDCPYKIIRMLLLDEDINKKNFVIYISLDIEEEYQIAFIFTSDFIDGLFCESKVKKEDLAETLIKRFNDILTKNDNFLLIRLTQIALGDYLIIESLKNIDSNDKEGRFYITLNKWKVIMNYIMKKEITYHPSWKIKNILSQGEPTYITSDSN